MIGPLCMTNKHLEFLDELRESGSINMFLAPLHLEHRFELSNKEAVEITKYWMNTFEERHK